MEPCYEIPAADLAYLIRSVVPILPAAEWERLTRTVASTRTAIDRALTAQRGANKDALGEAEAVLAMNRTDLAQFTAGLLTQPPLVPQPLPPGTDIPWPSPGPFAGRPEPKPEPNAALATSRLPAIILLAAGAEFYSAFVLLTTPPVPAELDAGASTSPIAQLFHTSAHAIFTPAMVLLGKHEP